MWEFDLYYDLHSEIVDMYCANIKNGTFHWDFNILLILNNRILLWRIFPIRSISPTQLFNPNGQNNTDFWNVKPLGPVTTDSSYRHHRPTRICWTPFSAFNIFAPNPAMHLMCKVDCFTMPRYDAYHTNQTIPHCLRAHHTTALICPRRALIHCCGLRDTPTKTSINNVISRRIHPNEKTSTMSAKQIPE